MAASEDRNRLDREEQTRDSELEQYGVWVKAGPEDVDESAAEDEAFALTDLGDEELEEAEMELLAGEESEPDFSADEVSIDLDEPQDAIALDEEDLGEDIDLASLDLDEPETASEAPAAEPEPEPAAAQRAPEEDELDDLLSLDEEEVTLDLDEDTEDLIPQDTGSEESADDATIDLEEPEPLAEASDEETSDDDVGELDELELEPLDETSGDDEPASPADELESLELESLEDEGSDEEAAAAVEGGIDIEDELPGDLDDLTLDLDSLDVDSYAEPTEGSAAAVEAVEGTAVEGTALEGTADEGAPEAGAPERAEAEAAETQTDSAEAAADLEISELDLEEDDLDLDSLDLGDDSEVTEIDLSALPGEEDEEYGSISEDELSQTPEDDLPELEADTELGDELADELSLDEGFDDLAAVEDEMTEPPPATEPEEPDLPEPASPAAGDERSVSLLESIERELSSIRTELTDLKQELSHLRAEPQQAAAAPTEAPEPGDEAGGGFFEDETDEDETIALTGAELDNIMSTAEFTEQAGEPTDYQEVTGLEPESELDLDQIGEPAGAPAEEPAGEQPVQEITLEEGPEDLGPIDLDLAGEPEAEESAGDEPFTGGDAEVEALASMDIDAELADIEELEDTTPEPTPGPAAAGPAESQPAHEEVPSHEEELPAEDDLVEEETLILDAEPLDEEPLLEEEPLVEEEPSLDLSGAEATLAEAGDTPIPENLKGELRSVLNYMDKLLDSLPEEKIQEFAASDHFKVYKRLFEELGLEQ